ncbi:hypothetical protein M4D48_14645 [Alkalihalobacillus clausii]|uniref:glycosyltransferase n=1 Tax=Shouchella clausii TaxID=79880 RepID=UPI000BA73CC5|nr:glycosyltransferase [Shouchella clausii]MCM3549815.1 hypothetical protein [Shouchella clausii]PAF15009.1 hypothetical protein CHH59_06675 [Shouchella clausii]
MNPNQDYYIYTKNHCDLRSKHKKVLITTFSRSSLGHMMRAIAIGLELQKRSHDVLLACAEETLYLPKSYGLNCVKVHELEPMPLWSKMNREVDLSEITKKRLASKNYIEKCMIDDTTLINQFKPDVVLHDMRITSGVSAKLANIPSISLNNIKLFNFPLSTVIPLVIDQMKVMGISESAIKHIFGDVVVIPDFSNFEPMCHIPKGIMEIINESVKEIYYCGPLMTIYPSQLPKKKILKKNLTSNSDAPLLYITFGGSPSGKEYLISVLKGLAKISANIVVSTGNNIPINDIKEVVSEIKSLNTNVSVKVAQHFENSIEIMKSADLAITHGGHGTLMEGIFSGTPQIIIPHNNEQLDNAKRCLKMNVGEILEKDNVQITIQKMVERMLADKKIQNACEEVSSKMAHFKGTENLANFIENRLTY